MIKISKSGWLYSLLVYKCNKNPENLTQKLLWRSKRYFWETTAPPIT